VLADIVADIILYWSIHEWSSMDIYNQIGENLISNLRCADVSKTNGIAVWEVDVINSFDIFRLNQSMLMPIWDNNILV